MKALALFALTMILAAAPALAEPEANPPAGTTGTQKPAEQPSATPQAAPAATPAATPAAAPAPAPAASAPVAKPAEDDIEVLSEVPDLQETEDPSAAWYGKGFPEAVRILALPTARVTRKGGFDFIIDHRSSTAIYDTSRGQPWADMGHSLAGLDGPMRIGLGLRYGVLDGLDVGVYRAAAPLAKVDTWELDVRYQALRQEQAGIDLAARAGGTWFEQSQAKDASGGFAQLLATRLIANRVLLSAAGMYHSNSTNATKYNQDTKYSVGVGGGAEVRLAAPIAIDAETVACVAGYCSKNPTFSGGVKYFTNRHTFALVCSNTQYITDDGYLANTSTPWKKLVIGFNITREY